MLSDSESVSSPQLLPDRAASDSGLHLISCSPRAAAASLPSRGGGPLADGGLLIKAGMICQWETKRQFERTWLKKTETQNTVPVDGMLPSVCYSFIHSFFFFLLFYSVSGQEKISYFLPTESLESVQ